MRPRLLLLLTGAFDRPGGIEAYGRLLVRSAAVYCAERGGRAQALALNDDPDAQRSSPITPPIDVRGFRSSKPRFVGAALQTVLRLRPGMILVGHVNLAPLALALSALARARPWFFLYGIDAWGRLPGSARFALRRAKVSAISEHTRRVCAAVNGLAPERIAVLPCALDPCWVGGRRGSSQPEQTAPIVLTVARLDARERYKGVDRVLEAFPTVLARIPDARYVVVGDGDDLPRLRALAERLGVARAVSFVGRADERQLDGWYRACRLFAMPSEQEGFGIVFLEAGYCGKPSIAGDHAGGREAVEEGVTGYRVPHSDVPALADRLLRLLSDEAAARALGAAARQRVESAYLFEHFLARFTAQLER